MRTRLALLSALAALLVAALSRSTQLVVLALSGCLLASICTGGFGFSAGRFLRRLRSRRVASAREPSDRGVIVPLLEARLARERARRARRWQPLPLDPTVQPLAPFAPTLDLTPVLRPPLRVLPGGDAVRDHRPGSA